MRTGKSNKLTKISETKFKTVAEAYCANYLRGLPAVYF